MISINILYAQGETPPSDPNSPQRQVVKVIELQPGADAEVILEDVEAKILSDGSISLSANGSFSYWWSHSDWGEGAALLWGRVILN